MKVFIVGDHRTGTGPANVTKEYIKNLRKFCSSVMYQKMVSKVARVPEIAIKTLLCDVILLSGYSKQNLLTIRFAKMFGKKTAYLMHGCVEHENMINGVPDEDMNKCERATMAGVDAIYAVSERFSKWLKENYPEYADKTDYVTNGIDGLGKVDKTDKCATNSDSAMIFSIGGGMPRKKIKHVCEAIEKLNEGGLAMKLVVVGDKGLDTDIINSYPFVENQGIVSHEKVRELFKNSDLFIQNSCFETFGLAPVEALSNGCNVLLSDMVGALDIIPAAQDCDIIKTYNDADEIASKILGILDNPNADRLMDSIDFAAHSWKACAHKMSEKLGALY